MKILIIIFLFLTIPAFSEEKQQIEITTEDGIEVFQIEKYYLLKKNVIINTNNFNLSADNVKAYFEKDLYDIIKIESVGNSILKSKKGMNAKGDKINFFIKDENILIYGKNSSLILNDIQMYSKEFINVNNKMGNFILTGKSSLLKTNNIEIIGSKINGNYINVNDINEIKDLYVEDENQLNIKTKKINMFSVKAQYNSEKNIIELFEKVEIYRDNEIIIGDYAKINTLTESYKVASKDKQKVKILIKNKNE